MKRLFLILFAIALAGPGAFAFEDLFKQAQTAYDEGRYGDAAQLYEAMLSNGVVNAEVHYNLANSLFKSGNLPPAVWHYRKAWYAAPRDPDINANLSFALNAVGAVQPRHSSVERFLTALSFREWIAVAIVSYLLLSALLILALCLRTARYTLLKLSLAPVTALLVTAGGWWQWRIFQIHPEAVVVNSGTTALFGPIEGATAHYKLPPGALVSLHSGDSKEWIEVEYDGKEGWIKRDDILRLSP